MSDNKTDSTVDCASEEVCVEKREETTIDVSKPDAETKKKPSTGPRTPHGKRRSSQNACKHGFFSREVAHLHRREEDRREYLKLLKRLSGTWGPIGQSEHIQIELMAYHLQQYKRAMRLMSAKRDNTLNVLPPPGSVSSVAKAKVVDRWLHDLPLLEDLDKIQRYEDHILRNYYKAQGGLQRLQSVRLGGSALPHGGPENNNQAFLIAAVAQDE